jgi:copper oxidase (laccase) domain-containing protein
MPRFYHDFTRELTSDETKRLSDICDVLFETFEWEREQPVHVCEQRHGGKVIEEKEKSADGIASVIRKQEFAAICHDCGRGLIRPRGGQTDTWICPSVHNHPLHATKTDSAVECGRS